MSGHKWDITGERCLLCGDKDWRATKYCSNNPEVKLQYESWVEHLQAENRDKEKDN